MSDRLTEACRATLLGWVAPSPAQDNLRSEYLDHLDRRTRGWSRECLGAHLTASSLICAQDSEEVLLTLHAKLGRWLQTGGHIEPADADLQAAALREATEESGLSALVLDPRPLLMSRHEVPCGPVRPCFHLDVQFLVLAPVAARPNVGPESHDVAWFGYDELPEVDASVRALVAAAADRLDQASAAGRSASRKTGMP